MKKLQEMKDKLNPKVAIIGGVLVLSTSLGTCHLMEDGPELIEVEAIEEVAEEAPEEIEEQVAPEETE